MPEPSALKEFVGNLKRLPKTLWQATVRHGPPNAGRSRHQAVFNNVFLHIHSTQVHPRSLKVKTTYGLGAILCIEFIILTLTGVLLMLYYVPSVEHAYDSVKDIHYVVPAGRLIRNMHRWAANLMVITVMLHMARVLYTVAYKGARQLNWTIGVFLLVLTFALAFTGYLLPWDQLAFWALTIGANIAASPNEVSHALGLPEIFNVGNIQREVLLGSSQVGQAGLIRVYVLHIMILPIAMLLLMAVHLWRVRKDGGLARPDMDVTPAGKGAATPAPVPQEPKDAPTKTFGLMCVIPDRTPYSDDHEPTPLLPSWPYLLRAELVLTVLTILVCVILGIMLDAPLKEPGNALIPENPAKAPWYFLGIQELVSYSAFVGGILIPTLTVVGLSLIPFLDRHHEPGGVWFSNKTGIRVTVVSALVATVMSVLSVAVPVNFGWLADWFPDIPKIAIIICNPGSLLLIGCMLWSVFVIKRWNSTRMGAIALFTCFVIAFIILTYVGTFLRGPNWEFFWSQSDWPQH